MSVCCVCCQVEVSATSWSLVQRSPTDCVASLCVTLHVTNFPILQRPPFFIHSISLGFHAERILIQFKYILSQLWSSTALPCSSWRSWCWRYKSAATPDNRTDACLSTAVSTASEPLASCRAVCVWFRDFTLCISSHPLTKVNVYLGDDIRPQIPLGK